MRGTGRYGISPPRSSLLRLDVGRPDHFAPFLGILDDVLAEFGGRACKRRKPQVGKARFHPLIGESSVNRLVERFDDLGGSVPGRADADEATCLVAEHKFTQGGDIAGRSRTQMDSV